MTLRLQIALFNGFDEIDVFGPYEMLSAPGIALELATVDEHRTVRSMRGVSVGADTVLDTCEGSSFPAAAGATMPSMAPGARWLGVSCPSASPSWRRPCRGWLRSAPEG